MSGPSAASAALLGWAVKQLDEGIEGGVGGDESVWREARFQCCPPFSLPCALRGPARVQQPEAKHMSSRLRGDFPPPRLSIYAGCGEAVI